MKTTLRARHCCSDITKLFALVVNKGTFRQWPQLQSFMSHDQLAAVIRVSVLLFLPDGKHADVAAIELF